jgi:hypothetical protein
MAYLETIKKKTRQLCHKVFEIVGIGFIDTINGITLVV